MPKFYGYAGNILRIDLTKNQVKVQPTEESLIKEFLGGRGFNSKRLYKEVAKGVDPLSPQNRLMFATGPLVGTAFPLGSRFNVSAKSPLTGILGDSNAGGHFSAEMKFAGYDQIIIQGKSRKPVYIFIEDQEIQMKDAEHLVGKDVYETTEMIRKDVGERMVQVATIGPAAENHVLFAGVFANLARPAARTGIGTVMASKNMKALALKGTGTVKIADPKKFWKLVEEIDEEAYVHPQYWPRRIMGTTRILMLAEKLGILPTRHFTSATFEHAAKVSGERLAREYNVKSRACFSCVVPCSRFYVIRDGEYAGLYGEGPEYEALSGFTARVGNSNLNVALKAVDLANRLGLDAITTAEGIAWAMELYATGDLTKKETGGLELKWGNGEAMLALIEKIAYREGFGDLLADGVRRAAEKLGKGREIALHVKGLEIIQADPRGLKGYGLGYAVASRGADHLRSEPFIELSDEPGRGLEMFGVPEATLRLAQKGKGKLVRYFENWCAIIDSLEVCKNLAENMELLPFSRAAEITEVTTGFHFTRELMFEIGERIINLESAYLVREGIRRKDDYLPARFLQVPLPNGNSKGAIFEIEPMLNEYYTEREWGLRTGTPKAEKLREIGLGYVVEDLKRNGAARVS
ncbi:MAG: aldehyde ferredoxin oxidoreductase family protein [Candidatus Bathyarchaeota archaeon]|nr:aldehyde ferredoxin oxidoreductase family protein [Candidatus Bathyarchaeota archaeon]